MSHSVLIDDVLKGIELVRPALPELAALDPAVGGGVTVALGIIYEVAVKIRDAEDSTSPEELAVQLRAKMLSAIDDLAALKFGAMAP